MTDSLTIEIVNDDDGFRALESEWNPLLRRSAANGVYLTFEYLWTWWSVYGSQFKLRILTVRRGEQLLAIAPLAIGPGPGLLRRPLRHLTFIGALGDTAAEFLDFIVEPGFEPEISPKLLETIHEDLGAQWDVLYLNLVPAKSPVLTEALSVIPQFHDLAVTMEASPSPFLPLPETWAELLSSKSKNFKKQFNNHWNRVHKNHKVEVLWAGKDIGLNDAFSELVRLNRKRWGGDGQAFKSKRFNEFHLRLAEVFNELGWLYFCVVKIDGKTAAARFDYVYNDKLWNIQGGWNPEFSHLSLGRVLIGMQIQWCIENGLKEYDFLAGESAYKRSWSSDARTLLNVEVLNPRSRRALAFHEFRIVKNLLDPRPRPPLTQPLTA